jgi:hypothetical protein
MPMRTRLPPLASLRVSITGSRPSWVRTWAAKSARIRSRRSSSLCKQLGDANNFVRAGMMGFAALNPTYARSICEVGEVPSLSAPVQNDSASSKRTCCESLHARLSARGWERTHVRHKTARLHHTARRGGGSLAVRGTCAAGGDAAGRLSQWRIAGSFRGIGWVLASDDPRNPSCLISCSHSPPEGSLSVFVGRHGAMNPAGRVRCNIAAIAKGYSCASQPFFDCATDGGGYREAALDSL